MDDERKRIILDWFGIAYHSQVNEDGHHSYFDFIQRDLADEPPTAQNEAFRLASEAVCLLLRSTSDTNNNDCPRPGTKAEILMRLKESNGETEDQGLKTAMHRAVRLIFRVNSMIGRRTAQVAPDWPDEKTVSEYVRSVFDAGRISSYSGWPPCSEPDDSEIAGIQARLTHRLTAVNIEKYTKIKIKETLSLPWHLKLYETYDYTTLFVFKDMRWLLDAVKIENFAVPREVIQETIDTLNYLYPKDRATARLLEREGINMHEYQPSNPDRPRFRDFKYYKPRMADVAYEFLNPPRRWKTIWKDRRNPMQFWTFWLGLLIFFFTLGFGVAATILAVLQLDVARRPPKSE